MDNSPGDRAIPAVSKEVELDFGVRSAQQAAVHTVQDRIALGTHQLRLYMALGLFLTFALINCLIMAGLFMALKFDFEMLKSNAPNYQRFVTGVTIDSLLAATTVQLGAVMVTITRFLFPNDRKKVDAPGE